jgi:hypothetical protein
MYFCEHITPILEQLGSRLLSLREHMAQLEKVAQVICMAQLEHNA